VKRHHLRSWAPAAFCALLLTILSVSAQVTSEDYDRAARLRTRFQDLTVNVPESANAIPNTSRFWYVFIRPKGTTPAASTLPLSFDGSEGNYYTLASIAWSPDSKRLVAYRVRPGYRRQLHYVESSPSDQVQPKHLVRDYAKPGDALDIAQPVLLEIESNRQIVIDNSLFSNPYSLSNPVWRKDGRAFTFDYNQRGHQVYRVVEVDTVSGKARAVINEESATFISYRPLDENPRDTGRKYRHDIKDGQEIL
jgi:hypothetical protein